MMTSTKLVVPAGIVLCALSMVMLALGSRPAPAPATVALIDLERVFAGLEERAAMETELAKRKDEAQARLNDMEKTLKKLNDDITLMAQGPDRKAKLLERARLLVSLRNEKDFSEQVLSLDGGEMLRDLYNKIDAAVSVIAQQQQINIVLANDEGISIPEGVTNKEVERIASVKKIMHADPSLDITQNVITYMNNQFRTNPGPSGAATPKGAAAPAPKK
jgi:Skp family chaperone for outer membrane proteins